ncbi:Uncharacterised protein [Vibrio fluvialis]|uniref:Uncharacterized protein n=1 Tax=Vibrio fluvialis TaxID=676 RepID=A0AAX2LVT3_VIBFL|nr:Uncharacterised protein [Vibrio fluvialis]
MGRQKMDVLFNYLFMNNLLGFLGGGGISIRWSWKPLN